MLTIVLVYRGIVLHYEIELFILVIKSRFLHEILSINGSKM
jgi:hypothetical protein